MVNVTGVACVAQTATGVVCNREAHYGCSSGHTLCPNHAIRLGGLRRKTDRKCRICADRKERSEIRALSEMPVANERRVPADESQLSKT